MPRYVNQCDALNMCMQVYGVYFLVRAPGAIMSVLLILRTTVNHRLQFGNTGAAVGFGLPLFACLIGGGEAFPGDGSGDGFFTDIEAGADGFAAVLLLDRGGCLSGCCCAPADWAGLFGTTRSAIPAAAGCCPGQ
jgi:hypothetical protein